METKVVIDIVCIHCGSKIQIQKKASQTQCKLLCPACKKGLHILFDIERDPQTYSFLSVNQSTNSKSTQENVEDEKPLSDAEKKAKRTKLYIRRIRKKLVLMMIFPAKTMTTMENHIRNIRNSESPCS